MTSAGAGQLANRLRRVERHLRSWRRREGVTCWRAYDADLPEYAAAIDVYEGWLHVQEYRAPAEIPEEVAARRLAEIVAVAADVLDVAAERVAVKQRRRQAGAEQYGRLAQRGEALVVAEGGLRFEVNLFDHLDTGLFLDHRPTRARLRDLARAATSSTCSATRAPRRSTPRPAARARRRASTSRAPTSAGRRATSRSTTSPAIATSSSPTTCSAS